MKLGTIVFFLVCCNVCIFVTEAVNSFCVSPQYFQIGTKSTVNCMFQENYTNLFWYDPTDPHHDNAVVIVQNSGKQGRGLLSGEFDIDANGSLIINNVTLQHEGTFTALLLQTLMSDAVRSDVQVFVFGPFFRRLPHIDDCSENNEVCFQTWNQQSDVSCFIQDARPAVPLGWMVRTNLGDENVTYSLSFTNGTNGFFTSRVTTTHPFTYSPFLALLVCKADGLPGQLEMNESFVLLLNKEETLPIIKPVKIYAETESKLEMNCSRNTIVHLAWHVRAFSEPVFINVAVAVLVNMFKSDIVDFNLSDTGSLMISNVTAQHEGIYRCISSTGFEDDIVIYEVLVFSSPRPRYLVVDGCEGGQDCTLEVNPEGKLTCSVKRIRPHLRLDFRPSNDNALEFIRFYDKKVTVKESGDAFDVSLTTKYSVTDSTKTRISIECVLIGSDMNILNLSTKLDLLITKDETSTGETSTDEKSNASPQGWWYYSIAILVILVVLLLLSGIAILKGIFSPRQQRTEENTPMVQLSKKRELMIDQLKIKYEDLYHALRPIPGLHGKPCCVNEVFVESRMQYLDVKVKNGGQANSWKKLDSYHRIFDDLQECALRCIVEGEPGYGKSTLALQLAYDWCNDITDYYEQETSILILLRLRQLSNNSSIYSSIKESLLPVDTKLSETDIENILSEKDLSVLVVMDGFDEYPHKNSVNDINSIIARNKLQSFKVILTTRTSHLPHDYPSLTKKVRLTGFDKNAREQYIRKVVPDRDDKAVDMIKKQLKDTPLMKDLCQVPLFFVMFVHLIYENEQFQSVTSFFRSVMACLHNHMKGKRKGGASGAYVISEENQSKLEEHAFKGLVNENQHISWEKEDLCERLGEDVYNQYISTGILVEENVPDFVNLQYKTSVCFNHDIVCEWFAAQHVAKHPSIVEAGGLKYLDPCNFQYVYRFACGLNDTTALKIILYLLDKCDTHIFITLCLMELPGGLESALHIVKSFCSSEFRIEKDHSRLLQRSTKEILEVASANQISVPKLWLYDSYSKIDLLSEIMQLKSGIAIPALTTLEELWIQETGGENIKDEITDIFQYSVMCEKLKELRFYDCLLPYSVQTEQLSALKKRKIKVVWQPRGFLEVEYNLNLVSGTWERVVNGAMSVMIAEDYEREGAVSGAMSVMTAEDYEREVKQFKIRYRRQETGEPCRVTEDNETVEAE